MLTIANVVRFVFFGGFITWLIFFVVTILAAVSIVGIPWARACWNLQLLAFWPFGNELIDRRLLTGKDDLGTGGLGLLGNIIWFLLIGWWAALILVCIALVQFVSIIGIPFGIQSLKLAGAILHPIGKTVVPRYIAQEARIQHAQRSLVLMRSKGRVISTSQLNSL